MHMTIIENGLYNEKLTDAGQVQTDCAHVLLYFI